MNAVKPPRLAAWILKHFGPRFNNEALAGDLWETFQQGRSKAWYWRQVFAAIYWHKHVTMLLIPAALGWSLTGIWMGSELSVGRLLYVAILTAMFLAVRYLPEILEGKLRFLPLAIMIFFSLLFFPWSVFLLLILVLHRKAFLSPRYCGTDRQRLMEKLNLAMLEEADPKVRQAYAQAITALRAQETSAAKATQ